MYNSGEDLGVYAVLGIGQAVLVLFGAFSLAIGGIIGSRRLHNDMLGAILRSPMSFFDTTPLGRILNRFSKVSEESMYCMSSVNYKTIFSYTQSNSNSIIMQTVSIFS